MAQKVRQFPSTAEPDDFRALEYFHLDVERALKLVGTATATVGSITAGAVGTVTVEVLGARPDEQQTVQVGLPSGINTGLVPWGNVTGKDTVTIYLYNRTASPIVVPEYTYGARVMP